MYMILAFSGFCFAAQTTYGATDSSNRFVVAKDTEVTSTPNLKGSTEDWSEMNRKEKKDFKKSIKKQLKDAFKEAKGSASDAETLLLVIVAILLPPLAMALYDGISNRFWISLLLTLLFYVPGLIYTLVIILGGK